MSHLKRIIRYKFSGICIVCLFTLAYLAFYYGAYESVKMNYETDDIGRYSYKNSEMYMISSDAGENILEQLFALNSDETYIAVADFPIYVDSMLASVLVQIEISGAEYRKYPIISGHMPNDEDMSSGYRLAVVGKNIKKYAVSQDGNDYITIQGEKYRITGYLASDASGIFNHTILLFADNIGNNFKDALNVGLYSGNVLLYAGSDIQYGITLFEQKLSGAAGDGKLYFQPTQLGKFYSTDVRTDNFKRYSVLIYIFCIVAIIFAVELWVMERKMEISIRKTFGEASIKIIWRIYRELFAMLIISGIVAVLLQLLVDLMSREVMAYSIGKIWFMIQSLTVCIVVTSVIAMAYPAYITVIQKPVKLLNTGGKR